MTTKPCKFCGSDKSSFHHFSLDNGVNHSSEYSIECLDCHCLGPVGDTQEEAVKMWNRSMIPDIPVKPPQVVVFTNEPLPLMLVIAACTVIGLLAGLAL